MNPLHHDAVEYEHTQPGTLVRVIIGGVVMFLIVMATLVALREQRPEVVVAFCIPISVSLLILLAFHSLTVRVSVNEIEIIFGIGLIRFRIPVHDVVSAEPVRNHWYNGWGIRLIRKGWLYNVSGFDAVEVRMKNGRRYRIGTDEPQQLHQAILAALSAHGNKHSQSTHHHA